MHRGSRGTIYTEGEPLGCREGNVFAIVRILQYTCNSHSMIVSVNWIFVIY